MRRMLKALLLTLLAYLTQVCILPFVPIGGVVPSAIFAVVAILTVSYGKLYAFGSSALAGIILESMNASVTLLNVVLYPVLGLLCAQFFADRSERQREQRQTMGKSQRELPAHLRIVLNAAALSLLFDAVHLVFIYLTGVDITFLHIRRMATEILYTAGLTAVLMAPVRLFLGMYPIRARKRRFSKGGERT